MLYSMLQNNQLVMMIYDMLTPTGYSPPIQQPIWPTAHTAHSQHCGHTALPPGQKTNPFPLICL